MSQPVGPLVDTVLQRIFDAGAVGTSRAMVRDLFARCKAILNAAIHSVLGTVNLTVQPFQQVYAYADIASDVIDVIAVRAGARDLSYVEFKRLKQIDFRWFGATELRLRSWSTLAHNLLIVHPMLPMSEIVSVIYVQQPAILGGDADLVQLADDEIPALTKMVEALLRLRQRDFGGMKELLNELQENVKELRGAGRV